MIKGVSVDVYTPASNAKDRFGNAVYTTTKTTVDNVLIVPGATDEIEASRPEGVTVAYTLHFPKTFTASLEGCKVELPAPYTGVYDVMGAPTPYLTDITPTYWHMQVGLVSAHG